LVQGREQSLGRSVKRLAAASLRSPTKSPLGGAHGQLWGLWVPSPSEKGEGQCVQGRNRIQAPAGQAPGPHLRVRQKNQDFDAAINSAVREARGELWAFLDSDDIWPREKTSEHVENLRRRPEVGVVYSDTQLIDPYDRVLASSVWVQYTKADRRRR
jgi:glycosyltransferase involved in cell wall biosynthesis